MRRGAFLVLAWLVCLPCAAPGDEPVSRERAAAGLRRAVEYFRTEVATEGGYLWRYGEDLARREGEGKATATQVWVQPPGTPAVGLAYLAAYEATGDGYHLDAARDAARALVRGQLRSGGWTNPIEFDPKLRKRFAYRVDGGGDRARNVTSLDDDTTQSAVRFLVRVDAALKGKDDRIREATRYALTSLLKAQYPNGAWPHVYSAFPDPAKFPVKKANIPETWPRAPVKKEYWEYYTLNDNLVADLVDTLLEAARLTGEAKYREAAERAGGFLLLAQLPEPQPGWAQQYDFDMRPAWARKFEPPAVSGGEGQGAMRTLLRLYRETGDNKYLEPIPRALAYYRRSLLPDGRLARFYELGTNRPLYFTRKYELTHEDDDLPTHYGFKLSSRLDEIAREYDRLRELSPEDLKRGAKPAKGGPGEARVKAILAAQDERGRWVEAGRLRSHGPDDPTRRVVESRTFIRNVELLSAYLVVTRPE
jgi:PelA/Pel-15E family pectate lyase